MASLGDLELMIQSRYPFIAVETSEEDRLETTLSQVAGDLRVAFFVWTLTNGLHRFGLPNAIYDSQQPLKALNNVAAMAGEAIFLMKDLHHYLTDPAVVRKCLDLAPAFGHDRRVIVMSAVKVELPSELAPLAARFTLDLPGPDELKSVVRRVVTDCAREHPVSMALSPADLDRLVDRLRGFTAFEAERAITRAILRDHTLDAGDIDLVVEIKKEMLRKDGVLEYVSPEENLAEVGGFKNLKAWLEKRKKAFAPEARQFGIDSPRGILLLGVQGCGKTMVARAVAREWGLPLLKMEPARLYDKYVGRDGDEPGQGAADGRADGALRADDRRAGEGPLVQPGRRRRRRPLQARVRPAARLAAGSEGPRLRGGHVERHRPAAPRADAQGTLRRDLLRGPAERRGAQGYLRRSSPQAEARPEAVRPRCPRRRVGRLQRRGDRAGGRRRSLHRVLARRGGQLRDHRRGAEGDEAALGHARGDDLRAAGVGARPDGHGELVRSMTRDCGAGRRGHPLRFDSAPMNRVLRPTAARGAS